MVNYKNLPVYTVWLYYSWYLWIYHHQKKKKANLQTAERDLRRDWANRAAACNAFSDRSRRWTLCSVFLGGLQYKQIIHYCIKWINASNLINYKVLSEIISTELKLSTTTSILYTWWNTNSSPNIIIMTYSHMTDLSWHT